MAHPSKTVAKTKLKPKLLAPEKVEEIFKRFKKQNPHPRTELQYTNVYTLLVAVVLSAQATDVGVNKATGALFKKADTPEKMVKLGEDGLKKYINTIGLYNAKAKNVIALSKMLLEKHAGEVPRTHEELIELPGVGNKTANVVLNEAFGVPTIAVDTHIFRVSQRLDLAHGTTPEQIEAGLHKIIPKKYQQHAHHWILLHGRYVCKARTPECYRCMLCDLCPYEPKALPKVLPKEK
jgi:endonuclease-3